MKTTRRNFLRAATLGAGVTFIPSYLRAGFGPTSPNAQINIAVIGAGRQSHGLFSRTHQLPDARFVAVCDVHAAQNARFVNVAKEAYAALAGGGNEQLKAYSDYRQLLDHPDLDAVLIATPDHQHAQICIDALDKGLHVYCEKPLAHTVEEGRAMVEAVERNGKVLQTGSMQRSMPTFNAAIDVIRAGKLGELKEAIVSIGPPPKAFDLSAQAIPDGLDWKQWIGPSVERPYNSQLLPTEGDRFWGKWRDYAEFGGGMITDWGAHMFDIVQWALERDDSGPSQFFPSSGDSDYGLTMYYDDGFRVEHRQFGRGNAVRFVGTEGSMDVARGFVDSTIPGLVSTPVDPPGAMNRNAVHMQDFYDGILKGSPVICPAESGHRTSSMCTLANIAYRLRRPLVWDPATERISNDRRASRLLGPEYRLSLA